jgi:hypothetical protein
MERDKKIRNSGKKKMLMVQVHTFILNKNLDMPRFFLIFHSCFFFFKMEVGCLLLDIFITSEDLKLEFNFLD